MDANSDSSTQRRSRRYSRAFRLSIRGLFLSIFVVCALLAWLTNKAVQQRRAVNYIRSMGGLVFYDYDFSDGDPTRGGPNTFVDEAKSNAPSWLVDRLGIDFFHTVVENKSDSERTPI